MVDELRTEPTAAVHCPWCSAEIAPALSTCPACRATLVGDTDASLPGLTALDQEAIARSGRSAPQRRGRLLSWISGDYDDGIEKPAPPGSLSPPPFEVRREMLRLEIEAETASIQAQTDALAAEAALEAEEANMRARSRALAAEATLPVGEEGPTGQVEAGPSDADEASARVHAADEDRPA